MIWHNITYNGWHAIKPNQTVWTPYEKMNFRGTSTYKTPAGIRVWNADNDYSKLRNFNLEFNQL